MVAHGRVITSSCQITEVKQRRAQLILGWMTGARVMLPANHYNLAFLVPPGGPSLLGRQRQYGNEACPRLLHMTSNGNRSPDQV